VFKQVIDAVNAAMSEGPLSTVKDIVLTREEMDEFMAANPFTGGVGKFYGDADVPALMHVQHANDGQSVTEFYLSGIRISAPPPAPKPAV
jgi:hypothetical protein